MKAHPEFGRYLAVGGVSWVIDTAVYWAALQSSIHYQGAALAGFLAGVCMSYALSVRWVFASHRHLPQGAEFGLFLLTGGAGLLLTIGMLWVLVEHLHVAQLPAKVLVTVLVLGSNYSIRKKILFSAAMQRPAMSIGES